MAEVYPYFARMGHRLKEDRFAGLSTIIIEKFQTLANPEDAVPDKVVIAGAGVAPFLK